MSVAFETVTPDEIPFHMVLNNILLAHCSKEEKCPCSEVLDFFGWEWDTGAKG